MAAASQEKTGLVSRWRERESVLILRGGRDYLGWKAAYQYKQVFTNLTLPYVPDAGHSFGYDQPTFYSSNDLIMKKAEDVLTG